ncbi:MAG: hypothetical protein P8L31_01230, partial [Pseudomonadales bacterium]|nr:hypothetical protein [Pseudomonadales bacterium]
MKTPNIDFMGGRKIATIASSVLLILTFVSLAINGLNWGLDFTGGSLVEVSYDEPVEAEVIRQFLESEGFQDGTVQYFGTQNDILIRMPPQEGLDQSSLGDRVLAALKAESLTV